MVRHVFVRSFINLLFQNLLIRFISVQKTCSEAGQWQRRTNASTEAASTIGSREGP